MKNKTLLLIRECFPGDADVKPLLESLSRELLRLTGNDGTASFLDQDVLVERSVFLVAVVNGKPVGCGGLRPITNDVCEIKRMYAKYRGQGIGSAILHSLEHYALKFGYQHIWLETWKVNEDAVRFYFAHRYRPRSNYGKYIGREEAICFEKDVAAR